MNLGQLFLAGFDGTTVDDTHPVVETIVQDKLGGVILFDRNIDGARQNITSPQQLRKLTADLQEIAGNTLLIAVDQEGGKVCRLKEKDGFPPSLSATQLAALGDEELLVHLDDLAATLKYSGINFNLAPVVDLDVNPDNPIIGSYDRSFGPDPQRVCELAEK